MASFGSLALASIADLVRNRFTREPARALWAGLAAHSFLPLTDPGSAGFALILGMLGHAIGWPIPIGGAQAIARALSEHFRALGGRVETGVSVLALRQMPESRGVLFYVTPRQLVLLLWCL